MTSKDRGKELIRELKELGRLLDPETETAQDEATTSDQTQLDTDEIQTTSELAAPVPVLDPTEDLDSPETVDMFSTESLVDEPATISNSEPETAELLDDALTGTCLLYTSPRPRDATLSRMPSSA